MTSFPIPQSRRNLLKDWIILIVDDQPDNLAIAQAALEYQGAIVHIAANGEEGLAALKTLQPSVVLTDLSMPKMDGWEMLRRLRALPGNARMPVIALTAHAMDGDKENAIKAGFNGYITKPFSVVTLAVEILDMLESVRSDQQAKS